MKPYVCPKCFTTSAEPDKTGACPACGHSTEGSRLLLGCSLTVLALTLLVIILGSLYYMAYLF